MTSLEKRRITGSNNVRTQLALKIGTLRHVHARTARSSKIKQDHAIDLIIYRCSTTEYSATKIAPIRAAVIQHLTMVDIELQMDPQFERT